MTAALHLARFGTCEPEERRRAVDLGPFRLDLIDGQIAGVAWRGTALLSGLPLALRDPEWSTLPLTLSETVSDRCLELFGQARVGQARLSASLAVRQDGDALDLAWRVASSETLRLNRIGPAILHGASLSGGRFRADGVWCTWPQHLRASPIASGFRQLVWSAGRGVRATLDLDRPHEMEDQRLWMDASFKSYAPPLSEPRPLTLDPAGPATGSLRLAVAHDIRARARTTAGHGFSPSARWPRFLALPGGSVPGSLPVSRIARLDGLESSPGGMQELLGIVLTAADAASRELPGRLHALLSWPEASCDVALLWPAGIAPDLPRAVARALSASGGRGPGGGGVAGHAAQLLRQPQTGGREFIMHALCPTVHDAGDAALLSTPASLPALARSVRRVAGSRGYTIGPFGISLVFRPDGTVAAASPASRRETGNGADPRDHAAIGRVWAIAALAALCRRGPDRVVLTPALAAGLPWLAAASGSPRIDLPGVPGLVQFGWTAGGRTEVVIATTGEPRQLRLSVDPILADLDGERVAPGRRHLTLPPFALLTATFNAVDASCRLVY